MGLLFAERSERFQDKSDTALLHQLGCKVCPLALQPGRMEPTGAAHPLIYVLGEAPGADEIELGRQFVGRSGQLLREFVPRSYIPTIRWNNCVRSRPPKNRTPGRTELECCRPSVEGDIERTKPKVIFGFGNVPLQWVSGFSGITYWRGRRMPVQIGQHVCWFYPFLHPAYLLRNRRDGHDVGSEDERMTALDISRAIDDLESLPAPIVHSPERVRSNVTCLYDIRRIEEALRWASRQPHVGMDYETEGLRPYEGGRLLTAAVGTVDQAYAFPFDHPGHSWTIPERRDLDELWKRFLERAPCTKVVHNLAFEMEWTGHRFGHEFLRMGKWEDTQSAAAIIDSRKGKSKPGCFSLEFLIQQYYGVNIKKLAGVNRANLASEPLDKVLQYNGVDSKYHDGLWIKQWPIIKARNKELAYDLAVRRVPTVTLAQLKGVPVNQITVGRLQKKYDKRVDEIKARIFDMEVVRKFESIKGIPFKPLSNPDVAFIFDELLRRPEVWVYDKWAKREKLSADESVLTQIDHPLAKALMDLRQWSGNRAKYIHALKEGHAESTVYPDHLVHTQFNTVFAETGRLSSEVPNLQNFPKRDDESKELRSPIQAADGCLAFAADYGQIEARVIAMFTKDKRFCKALWDRYDVHLDWAERLAYAWPQRIGGKKMLSDKKAMKDFRTDIKNQWTFPLFFGARAESVADYLKMPLNIIRPKVKEFWKEFSGVRDWQVDVESFYKEHGYVECLTGRQRHGPLSLNQIINSPIQGTAAEIVMDAMCRLSESGNLLLQPELQIHDDLSYFRVPEREYENVAESIIDTMVNVPFDWINVPITIEVSVGTNWAPYDEKTNPNGLKEVGSFSSDTWKKAA